jgi:hypothetical protein
VIGELILSLSPEESARVFPELYLPIVTEANRRVWEPWRGYMPTPHNFKFHRTVGKLNAYVSDLIRKRWAEHCSGHIQEVHCKLFQSLPDPARVNTTRRLVCTFNFHPLLTQPNHGRYDNAAGTRHP